MSAVIGSDVVKSTDRKPWRLRVAAYLCSALVLLNPMAPALADILDDAVIEQDVNDNPFYLPSSSSDYSFSAPQFVEWPSSGTKSLETVYQKLIEEHPSAISPPTYVPIGVGDITTFIPTYKRYKYLSTPAAQARYVRSQVVSLLGRNLFQTTTEAAQLEALYGNAIEYMKTPGAPLFGTPLYYDQADSGLREDMIWPELRLVNGQEVIVPVVYLTSGTVAKYKVVSNEQQAPSAASFNALTISNSNLKVEREGFLQVSGDLRLNSGASISGAGALKIVAGGRFDNASSVVQANGDLTIGAKSIHNHTIVYRYDLGHEQGTRYGQIADIASTDGDVLLESHGDITFLGADASAEHGTLTLDAKGNILIGKQQLYSGSNSRFGTGTQTRSQVSYLQSHLTAEDTIKLMAGGQIVIDAAEIVSDKGHIELLAGMGVTVVDAQGVTQSQASGKFGKKKVDESVYQTVAIRSLLDAGKGIKLNTEFGNITLKAADITSGTGTQVAAENGAVKLLMTTETDHYSYSSVKKGLFTTTTVSKGRNIETGVPNSIVGGFAVEALNGITVEYEGDPELSTNAQLDKIAEMPGMEWIDTVRNSPDVDWNEILLKHEEWSESNTSLSPAFAAVVAIAVAVATGGAGAAAAGAIGATGTAGTMVAAGVSSMISQSAMAVANGAVNGDISGALDDLASSDTFKSLVVSMVTAGAIAELDAAFFNVDSAGVTEASSAVEGASTVAQMQEGVDAAISTANATAQGLSLTSQAFQAVTHATVQAGAQAVITGSDFEEGFIQALVTNSLSVVGEKLANKIGNAKASGQIGTATQLVSHAAVGCLTGTITAVASGTETEDGCVSGSGGAVIGELIGLAYAANLEQDLNDWVNEQVAEDVVLDQDAVMAQAMEFKHRGANMAKLGAALTAFAAGGDVNIAANAGQNAAEHNAFFLVAIVAVAAYTSYVSYKEGGLYEGLQALGRGEDPLAQALNSAAETGVQLAAEHFPEETQRTAQILLAAGDKIAAGVKVVMETDTGETVTRYWNEIPEDDRAALIGAGSVVSMVVPAGVVTKLKTLGNLDVEAGDWIKDPKHPNWDAVSDVDRRVLDSPVELATEIPPLVIGGNDFSTVANRIDLDTLHSLSNSEVGEIGEAVAINFLSRNGYSLEGATIIKNPSDNGIDIIAYGPDGVPAFFEVKSTRTGRVGGLSGLQENSDSFVRDLLDEGGINGTIRNQIITPEQQMQILNLRNQVLSSDEPIRATAIGVDLLNMDIRVSKW